MDPMVNVRKNTSPMDPMGYSTKNNAEENILETILWNEQNEWLLDLYNSWLLSNLKKHPFQKKLCNVLIADGLKTHNNLQTN